MTLNYEQLLLLRELNQDLDSLVENLQITHSDLATAIFRIYEFLSQRVEADVLFVETQDENLNNRVFCYGNAAENLKRTTPQLIKITEANSFSTPGKNWFVQPLEMAGNFIGSIGMAFLPENAPAKELGAEILDCVSEELDNFFFGIYSNRLKHSIIMGLQSALKNHSIIDSIDGAAYVLKKEIPFEKMIILYTDRELTGIENYNYLVYNGMQRVHDSFNTPHEGLENFFSKHESPLSADPDELKEIIGAGNVTVSYLLDGLIEEELIGKVILIPEEGAEFSIFCREIIQVFTESLRQRLVDFNRERNGLRKFFSDKVINQLTSEIGYDKLYLSPRDEEIGIIFADISGFTKMSEQILKSPERITDLVDKWSNGILERVFPLGGCLDKLVGDCVIILFGPPFYRDSAETIVENSLKAAEEIVKFTREFLRMPENKEIQQHEDFDKFGVAIGINYCPAVVGLIGPNEDLTAFSSGMNITARLQGLAKADQILVTEKVHLIASASDEWQFEGPDSAPVKNVKDPLVFYKLIEKD
ncbi:MAG: adenylate cyclase [Clostridiales bacterium]|nr:adenylate cyclase [Clostridiales bacterium]MDN5282149.1 adenylate cyclase [Candidatus Ozemobacter sp.]